MTEMGAAQMNNASSDPRCCRYGSRTLRTIGWCRPVVTAAATAAILVHLVVAIGAQRPSVPPYAPPRTADGKPDLHGIWQVLSTAAWDLVDHSAELGVPAGQGVVEGGVIPYLPSAAAQRRNN